ncbi:MAG TPA: hypothetical protein VIP80_11335 [Gemmatimonadales bacterium]
MPSRRGTLALLLLLGALGCRSGPSENPEVRDVLEVPASRMREVVATAFRLKPDRRFLLAAAELESLILGKPARPGAARFVDGSWQVTVGGKPVGMLPLLPGFGDGDTLLTRWARELLKRAPLAVGRPPQKEAMDSIAAGLAEFFAPSTAAALQRIDRSWQQDRSPELVPLAARGLVALTLQAKDLLEVGDALPAKAFAAAVLAGAIAPESARREKALLAHAMGYTGEAVAYGGSLPPADPVRLFVERRMGASQNAQAGQVPDHLADYLYLLRLTDLPEPGEWAGWISQRWEGSQPTTGIVGSGLTGDWFDLNAPLAGRLAALTAQELTAAAGPPDSSQRAETPDTITTAALGGALRALEQQSARLDSRYAGPFLDGPAYRAYFRGHFYSALYVQAHHLIASLASLSGLGEFATALTGSPPGTAAGFADWVQRTGESMAGNLPATADLDDLEQRDFPAHVLREWTLEHAVAKLPYADPRVLPAVGRLVSGMDTRIAHQLDLAHVALTVTHDLRVTDRLYRRISELAAPDHAWNVLWYAMFSGQAARIGPLLTDSTLPELTRSSALSQLAESGGLGDSVIRAEFRRIIQADPARWTRRDAYAGYLMRHDDYPEALRVVSEWFAATGARSRDLTTAAAMTRRAYILDVTGKPAEAWAAIEPAIGTMKGEALGRGALILAHLGRHEAAESLALLRVARYPNVAPALATPTEVLWIAGKDERAAEWLVRQKAHFGTEGWTEVGTAFARAFWKRPLADGEAAFGELRRQGLSIDELWNISTAAAGFGRNDLAFVAESSLKAATAGLEEMMYASRAYKFLKRWRGPAEALQWMRGAVPPELREPASMIFYREGEGGLLWELIGEPQTGDHGRFVWLMRAAAAVDSGLAGDPHRAQFLAYYGQAGKDAYFVMGRYLLGLATEAEMLGLAKTPDRRCEVAYYLGVRARAEGRYEDASDWFLVAVATGETLEGEYTWATDQLANWAGTRQSLAVLAARRNR